MIKTEIYKLDRIEDGIAAIETPNGRIEHQKAEVLPEGANPAIALPLKTEDLFRQKPKPKNAENLFHPSLMK